MSRNDNLNQFDELIDELQQSDERPYPRRAFKQELRRNLLNQYENPTFSLANLGRLAGAAVAFATLAFIVWFSWVSLRPQPAPINAQMRPVDVPGRNEFIVYDQLRIELPMWVEFDAGWAELTAESWQSLDGTFFRGELVDATGKQRVFAQSDGQFLWRGTYNSSVEQMDTVTLQYFDVYHALAQAEGWAGSATTPPFYDDIGWGGLMESVLQLDWDCEGAECVAKYLAEPPLDVNSRGGEYEPYGWGVSLIDTETTANGRSLTIYHINYSPNQDGTASSQYRLVKLDSNNHTVVEVADYDGETLLRRLERVSHQIMTNADLPEEQFTHLPDGTSVAFVLPEGRITANTPLLDAPNGEQVATLTTGAQLTLSGLMNNQLPVTHDGTTWQYVSVPDVGQGWVDEATLEWPLTSDGQLVDLDTGRLPTAVPTETQLIILQNYRDEILAYLPQASDDERPLAEQALNQIEAEIARLEQQQTEAGLSSFNDELLLTRHQLSATLISAGGTVDVALFWEGEPESAINVAVHLTDANGNVLSQTDQPFSEEMNVTVAVPETLADDVYEIVVIQYDAATGVRQDSLVLQEIVVETAVTNPEPAPNGVWLIAATQEARSSADAPITLEITVGYQFAVDEAVTLKPLYAHPEWDMANFGRVPIDGLGEEIVLDGHAGTHTFTFSESPTLMREVVGSDQPMLVMQLAYLADDGVGDTRLHILAMPTFTGFAIDLTSSEEIVYP
ncbi:hypothetical protein [Candidatus Leptofilum sp.]|uniref:hypothetical protein n=1 Tax=Candidatus Leptofilum sp. TaxID=3241576 RepID=UPI003B5BDA5F